MTAVDIEHAFAGALGISEGQRNDVNDADYVRSGKPRHLADALGKVLPRLKKRTELLPKSDPMKRWTEISLSELEEEYRGLSNPAGEAEISKTACFDLWSFCAIGVRLIDRFLAENGC